MKTGIGINGNWMPYNPNPKGRKINDCSVRSMCAATGLSWEHAFGCLAGIAAKQYRMMNEKQVVCKMLQIYGFEKRSLPKVEKGGSRVKVDDFAQLHPVGVYVLHLAGHVVCVKDGAYYDSWDCGHKAVYDYWEKI